MKKKLAFILCGMMLGMSACNAGTQQINTEQQIDTEQVDQGRTQTVERITYAETLEENIGDQAQTFDSESIPQSRRMVMVNGTLYEDTGYVSGVWGRCGMLDGNIVSVIDDTEIPTEDGQANFQAPGWQIGFEENTIEVPVDGEYCIFAAQGSKEEGYIPLGVANFLATVEEVTDDGFVIVKTDMGVAELFRGRIKENERYKVSLEHYTCDINIPVENVVPGAVLQVVCKNNLEDTDPAVITDVYSVSPLHSNVSQPYQYPPEVE